MEVFVFKTNVTTKNEIIAISQLLDNTLGSGCWTFDLEDVDNIFRVETDSNKASEIISNFKLCGFICEELQ
ncbi:hypothetical protein [Flavobacterium turcicum]|uniref:Uncharacterized protein n=1 Tax=Flavobacterium turcicum TaxID=2764718 RepID=A0ABR7JE80_9FLAO|nr:hypothetical protein [Flavobacterium turcicum]MBC5862816.1 hypothetical protein [Flavobacterium turcicum]NHL01548.1 hypothetical protein [Flavobacterium turcicum]